MSTKTYISDLFDPTTLDAHVQEGLVRVQTHPHYEDLSIATYTQKTAYLNHWDEATRACRGLIFRPSTGEVLGRPWNKFFNHTQPQAAPIEGRVEVTDKMDGSLIIGFSTPDGSPMVATKGSFASEQAIAAQDIVDDLSLQGLVFPEGITPLFEYIAPENRIVLDYNGETFLSLLGGVHIESGHVYGPNAPELNFWKGRRTEVFSASTLTDALALTPRPNAEGIVIRAIDSGNMVKVKQEDYIRLHKAITGLSKKVVWEHMMSGTQEDLLELIPDEMFPEVQEYITSLRAEFDTAMESVYSLFLDTCGKIGHNTYDEFDTVSRKRYALTVKDSKSEYASLAMSFALSGKPIGKAVWNLVKPTEHETLGWFAA